MTRMRLGARALMVILGSTATAILIGACEGQTANSEDCLPGDYATMTLEDGGQGFIRCSNEGGGYEPYSGSNPNALPDAKAAEASVCGAVPLGYFCSCTEQAQCASGLDCTPFVNKVGGSICTPACTTGNANMLCVPPSQGCGNNGHCKP